MSANKRKGSQFERDVVGFLADNGYPDACRIYATGQGADLGDIDGVPGWALQCKNTAKLDVPGALDDANHQASNKGVPYGAAVIKRRTKGVASSYVVMDLATFAAVLRGEGVRGV